MRRLFLIIFLFYSFEISAFPKKKDALIKEKINKNDYEVLLETGHHLFFIEYCNYSNSPNDKKFYKNIKGLIAYTNWNLFLIFNAGYQDINKKIDQDKRLRKAKLNWMYGFRDCEINSLNKGYEAIDNLFEIIIEYLIEHNQEEYQNNLSKLISLLEEDKKDDYSLVINELKKRVDEKLGFKDDTAKKNQEIEDSQIEKVDNSETNNQLDLTETEDLPQNKVDNELIVSLEEAKQILILVQEFLPTNPTEFDIVALTTLIQKNKEVLQNSWSNEQQDNFRELYDFLFQSDAFSNFKIAKEEETRKAKEGALKQERVSLDQNISLLKDYLTQNMFADDAPQVLEMIAEGESLQSSANIEELKTINTKINSFINEKSVKNNSKSSSSLVDETVENVSKIFKDNDYIKTNKTDSGNTAEKESNKSGISFELSLLVNTSFSGCSDGIVFFDYIFYKDKKFKQVAICNDGQNAVSNAGIYEEVDNFNEFIIKYMSKGTEVIDKFKKERYGDWDWEVVWNSEIVYESGYGPSPQYYKEADNKEIRDKRKQQEQARSNIYTEVCERLDIPSLNKDEFLKNYSDILHLKEEGLDQTTHGPYEEELLFNKNKIKKLSYTYYDDQATEGIYDWAVLKQDGDAFYIYFKGEKRNEYNVTKEEDEVYHFEKNKVERNFCYNLAKEIKQREYEDPEDRWEYSQQYYVREKFDIFRSPESYLLNWDQYTFQPQLVKDFIPEKILEEKKKEKENKLNSEIDKSKGGYKGFYFDMNFDQLNNEVIKTCEKGVTKITNKNLFNDTLAYYYPVDVNNLKKNCIEFAGKKRPTYFYLNARKKIEKIKIELEELPNQFVNYLMNNSGVTRYDEIVKLYKNSDKYETVRYPTKIEIEDFNNQNLIKMYEDEDRKLKLNTIFKNKKIGNIVIVELGKTTFDNVNFGTFIVIQHFSLKGSEYYLKKEKDSEIKSDDL